MFVLTIFDFSDRGFADDQERSYLRLRHT
jgi:hypothetical protein